MNNIFCIYIWREREKRGERSEREAEESGEREAREEGESKR